MKKHIPNLLTLGNLFCGLASIVLLLSGDYLTPMYLVGLAAIFDFLDGMVARILKVAGPLGKELDSLADMVTFGVVPGMTLFILAQDIVPPFGNFPFGGYSAFSYLAFLVTLLSAMRLAKFNIDERQSTGFIGMPTPANTLLIMSIFYLITHEKNVFLGMIFVNPWYFLLFTVAVSFLLVAEIPLFALKFKKLTWKGEEIRWIFIFLSIILLLTFHVLGIPFIVLLYLVMSWIFKIFKHEV